MHAITIHNAHNNNNKKTFHTKNMNDITLKDPVESTCETENYDSSGYCIKLIHNKSINTFHPHKQTVITAHPHSFHSYTPWHAEQMADANHQCSPFKAHNPTLDLFFNENSEEFRIVNGPF